VHYLADLLANSNKGAIPRDEAVRVLDIGVGANAIYPLIGNTEYGWQFLGSDIDADALTSARSIIHGNPGLSAAIKLRQQKSPRHIFKSLLGANDYFDLTLCNPPFHSSQEEAESGSQRKWRGLGKAAPKHNAPVLNFGGQNTELWCEGGEALFHPPHDRRKRGGRRASALVQYLGVQSVECTRCVECLKKGQRG